MPMYWMALSIGVPMMESLLSPASSATSLGGRSTEMSASPRSIRARRFPAEGTMRQITRWILQGPRFPILVAEVDQLLPGCPFLDPIGAAGCGVVLQPLHRPGIGGAGVLLRKIGADDYRHRNREVRHGELVPPQEVDAQRPLVADDELLRFLERSRLHLECREAAHRDGAIEGPFHIFGGERRAGVGLRVLAQP